MRILLSEGGSTSARQAITALGLKGHHVEVCDPDPRCLGRFSRFVARFHRCPALGADPAGYLDFILNLLSTRHFDVLLPIHEQGFLFSKVLSRVHPYVAVALPSFESYARLHSKAELFRLLQHLGLPQPATQLVKNRHELLAVDHYPVVVKAAVGTASRSTWMVRTRADLQEAVRALEISGGFDDLILVQEVASGPVEHAQAVFSRGQMLGFHAWRQVMRGAGGSDALKESVSRQVVGLHVAQLGEHLAWHGAFTLDYIWNEERSLPLYIDGNPRFVEPMGAMLAGNDLMDLLLRVSIGEAPALEHESQETVRTHMAIQALLGHILAGGTRQTLLRELWRLFAKRGPYAGSREELTPVLLDPPSALPVAIIALRLLVGPEAALELPRRRWGAHLLSPESIRIIRRIADG